MDTEHIEVEDYKGQLPLNRLRDYFDSEEFRLWRERAGLDKSNVPAYIKV